MDSDRSGVPPLRLNEVRPRRPEQFGRYTSKQADFYLVSMKSGLEGRNNPTKYGSVITGPVTSQ